MDIFKTSMILCTRITRRNMDDVSKIEVLAYLLQLTVYNVYIYIQIEYDYEKITIAFFR